MPQNRLSQAIKTKTRLKLSSTEQKFDADHRSLLFSVFKEVGYGCDGSINQLSGNVLESHRRYWHTSKTRTVSGPAAMAFLFPLWKHILSYINPIFLFINTLRLSIFHAFFSFLPQSSQYLSSIVLLVKDKRESYVVKVIYNCRW